MKYIYVFVLLLVSWVGAATYTWTGTTYIRSIKGDWSSEGVYILTGNGARIYLRKSGFDHAMFTLYQSMLVMANSEQLLVTIQYSTDQFVSYSEGSTTYKYGYLKLIRALSK